MPGHTKAMKAVVSCDKPRGAAHTRDPWIAEWGNPASGEPVISSQARANAGELKHLSTGRKRNQPRFPK